MVQETAELKIQAFVTSYFRKYFNMLIRGPDYTKNVFFTKNKQKIYYFTSKQLLDMTAYPDCHRFQWIMNQLTKILKDQKYCFIRRGRKVKKIIAVGVKTTRIMSKFSMPWLELNFNFRGLTCPVYFLDTLSQCPFNSLQGTIASGDTGKSNTV